MKHLPFVPTFGKICCQFIASSHQFFQSIVAFFSLIIVVVVVEKSRKNTKYYRSLTTKQSRNCSFVIFVLKLDSICNWIEYVYLHRHEWMEVFIMSLRVILLESMNHGSSCFFLTKNLAHRYFSMRRILLISERKCSCGFQRQW